MGWIPKPTVSASPAPAPAAARRGGWIPKPVTNVPRLPEPMDAQAPDPTLGKTLRTYGGLMADAAYPDSFPEFVQATGRGMRDSIIGLPLRVGAAGEAATEWVAGQVAGALGAPPERVQAALDSYQGPMTRVNEALGQAPRGSMESDIGQFASYLPGVPSRLVEPWIALAHGEEPAYPQAVERAFLPEAPTAGQTLERVERDSGTEPGWRAFLRGQALDFALDPINWAEAGFAARGAGRALRTGDDAAEAFSRGFQEGAAEAAETQHFRPPEEAARLDALRRQQMEVVEANRAQAVEENPLALPEPAWAYRQRHGQTVSQEGPLALPAVTGSKPFTVDGKTYVAQPAGGTRRPDILEVRNGKSVPVSNPPGKVIQAARTAMDEALAAPPTAPQGKNVSIPSPGPVESAPFRHRISGDTGEIVGTMVEPRGMVLFRTPSGDMAVHLDELESVSRAEARSGAREAARDAQRAEQGRQQQAEAAGRAYIEEAQAPLSRPALPPTTQSKPFEVSGKRYVARPGAPGRPAEVFILDKQGKPAAKVASPGSSLRKKAEEALADFRPAIPVGAPKPTLRPMTVADVRPGLPPGYDPLEEVPSLVQMARRQAEAPPPVPRVEAPLAPVAPPQRTGWVPRYEPTARPLEASGAPEARPPIYGRQMTLDDIRPGEPPGYVPTPDDAPNVVEWTRAQQPRPPARPARPPRSREERDRFLAEHLFQEHLKRRTFSPGDEVTTANGTTGRVTGLSQDGERVYIQTPDGMRIDASPRQLSKVPPPQEPPAPAASGAGPTEPLPPRPPTQEAASVPKSPSEPAPAASRLSDLTDEHEGSALQFFSPNTQQLSRAQADAAFQGPRHSRARRAMDAVDRALGLAQRFVEDVRGVWRGDVDNSTLTVLRNYANFDDVLYRGAALGRIAQQKAVFTFEVGRRFTTSMWGDGAQAVMWDLKVPRSAVATVDDLETLLAQSGLKDYSISETQAAFRVLVSDEAAASGGLLKASSVRAFADAADATGGYYNGRSFLQEGPVLPGATDAAARRSSGATFDAFIRTYHRRYPERPGVGTFLGPHGRSAPGGTRSVSTARRGTGLPGSAGAAQPPPASAGSAGSGGVASAPSSGGGQAPALPREDGPRMVNLSAFGVGDLADLGKNMTRVVNRVVNGALEPLARKGRALGVALDSRPAVHRLTRLYRKAIVHGGNAPSEVVRAWDQVRDNLGTVYRETTDQLIPLLQGQLVGRKGNRWTVEEMRAVGQAVKGEAPTGPLPTGGTAAANAARRTMAEDGLELLSHTLAVERNVLTAMNQTEVEELGALIRGHQDLNTASTPVLRAIADRSISELKRSGAALWDADGNRIPGIVDHLLHEKTFFRNLGRYMPRMYRKHEFAKLAGEVLEEMVRQAPDDLRPQVREVLVEAFHPQSTAQHGISKQMQAIIRDRFLRRKDLTPELREALGEILEPAYPIAKGHYQMRQALETQKFFRFLASNEQWVAPLTNPGSNKALGGLYDAASQRPWVRMAQDPEFGVLQGRLVHPDVADFLQFVKRYQSEGDKFFERIVAAWKTGKTVLNPATHARNTMSNVILSDLAGMGLGPDAWRRHKAAAQSYLAKDADYELARRNNLFSGGWHEGEVRALITETLDPAAAARSHDFHGVMENVFGRLKQGAKAAYGAMAKAYEAEDAVFKMSLFKWAMERQGMSAADAAQFARGWMVDYGKSPWLVQLMAGKSVGSKLDTVGKMFASPFITWSAHTLPKMAKAALGFGGGQSFDVGMLLRFWKYPLFFGAATAASAASMGLSLEDVRKGQPDYMKTWLPGAFTLLPWKDTDGRMQWLDLSYVLPWGELTKVKVDPTNEREPGVQIPALLGLGGPMQPVVEAIMNRNLFRNQEIREAGLPSSVNMARTVDHIYRGWLPSMMPGIPGVTTGEGGHILTDPVNAAKTALEPEAWQWATSRSGGSSMSKVASALFSIPDYAGRQRAMGTVLADVALGLKVQATDPDSVQRGRQRDKQRMAREIQEQIREMYRDKGMAEMRRRNPEMFRSMVQRLQEQRQRILQGKPHQVTPLFEDFFEGLFRPQPATGPLA